MATTQEPTTHTSPRGRRFLATAIPDSSSLSDTSWAARHRLISIVAWLHVAGVPLYALIQGRSLSHALLEAAPIAVFCLGGSLPAERRVRSVSITLALMISSAVLVHLSGGLIEMHFHFFVMIPLIALYHDWLPFSVAFSWVLVHHGVVGTLEPNLVFAHAEAQRSPWAWAAVHAGFIGALDLVCIAGWRINEIVLDRQRTTETELLDEKRTVETLHSIGTAVVAELDATRVSQLVTDAAVDATGAQFGAFFYNVEDAAGDSYMLYTLSGVPRSAFESFPMPRNTKVFGPTFAGTGVVRVDDITKDARYAQNAPYHGMPPGHLPVHSYLAVPVRSRGSSEVLGGLFFGHSDVGVFTETHERIVIGIATQAAIAFDNARLYQAEREAHHAAERARSRIAMLAEAGRILVSTLDPAETLANLGKMSVPDFADICVIDMVRPDGAVERVDAIGAHGYERFAESLKPHPPDRANDKHPVVRVLAGEGPILTTSVTPELIADATRGEQHAESIRMMEGTSSIVVPLVGRGEVQGVVSFLTVAASDRLFGEEDVPLAEALGHRAGMAVENAQLYQAEREARSETDRARAHLTLLAEAGRLSATPLNEEIRIQQLAEVTVPHLADTCLIDVLEEDETIRRATAGAPGYEGVARALSNFPPSFDDEDHPAIKIMKGAPTVLVEHIDDAFLAQVTRGDDHRAAAEAASVGSAVLVPLIARGGTYGTLTLINFAESGRRFSPDDVPLAEEIGRRAGVAVHNARLYSMERRALVTAEKAGARLSLLSDASRVLASSLDIETTLGNVAALTVPPLADLCVIDMLEEDGTMRRVAASGAPGLEKFAEETRKAFPANPPSDHPVLRVVRGDGPQHITNVDRATLDNLSRDEAWVLRVEKTQVVSAIMVPLLGRESILGVMSLVTTAASGRFLPTDDIPLAQELGRRAGIAIENARLYAQQRSVAESLQHALLPQDLPQIPGFEVTARYQPGGPGERVGGDWYDLFEIPSGELAIVMGDVVGHGIPAASLMAQLRNALRAYVWDGQQPADVLSRLNQLLYGLEREGMATCSVGILDPIKNTLRFANAGHPPFLRLSTGTEAEFVGEGLGPPLGAVPFATFKQQLLQLAENDTLIFYTDGLIEDRAASIDEGFDRIRTAAAAGPPDENIDLLCDRILEAAIGDRVVEDDVALLVLRALQMGRRLSLRLPAEPRVLSSLRQTLRRWLREQEVDDLDVKDILVACGEACNNAIEHGAATLGGWFEIEAEIDGDLNVVVKSTGGWRPPRDDGGGRGIPVMEALMDEVIVNRDGEGIEVRLRRSLSKAKEPVR
jgi:GAF domain-containing protein/anti-sigma regulatory factor (Ser/Thr protein kinase)